MNNKLPGLVCLWAVLSVFSSALAGPSKQELVEVTPKNKLHCVEFFMINGKTYCSTKALTHEDGGVSQYNYDHLIPVFDQRTWTPAWGKETPQITTVEYILAGDDIKRWKELITSQYIPGPHPEPKAYAAGVMALLKRQIPDVQTGYLLNTPEEVIFEFKVKQPVAMAQHEIQRVFSRKEGLYIVHYVIKKPDMGEEARQKWIGRLKQAAPKR